MDHMEHSSHIKESAGVGNTSSMLSDQWEIYSLGYGKEPPSAPVLLPHCLYYSRLAQNLEPNWPQAVSTARRNLIIISLEMLSGSRCGQVIELETARVFKKNHDTAFYADKILVTSFK